MFQTFAFSDVAPDESLVYITVVCTWQSHVYLTVMCVPDSHMCITFKWHCVLTSHVYLTVTCVPDDITLCTNGHIVYSQSHEWCHELPNIHMTLCTSRSHVYTSYMSNSQSHGEDWIGNKYVPIVDVVSQLYRVISLYYSVNELEPRITTRESIGNK